MCYANDRAFTLIELLVVVTIIVVLLALLVPAMDKAIYAAELAVCGTNMHALGVGVTTYAMEHKRRYPYRPGVYHPNGDALQSWRDTSLATMPPFAPAPNGYDDRPYLRGYISINGVLNCPLAGDLDLDSSIANVYSNYQLFYGFRYTEGAQTGTGGGTEYRGMMKVGDKLRFRDGVFNILAGEEDDLLQGSNVMSAHPDKEGVMSLISYQDVDVDGSGTTSLLPGAGGGAHFTFSRWQNTNANPYRGPIDRNFLRGDGSVIRVTDITFKELSIIEEGEKRGLKQAPIFSGGNGYPTQLTVLPSEP